MISHACEKLHVTEMLLLMLLIQCCFQTSTTITALLYNNPFTVATSTALTSLHPRKGKLLSKSQILAELGIKNQTQNKHNCTKKYDRNHHSCTKEENWEEVRKAFQFWCKRGHVKNANKLLQQCVYYYYNCSTHGSSDNSSSNADRQQVLIRDTQYLLNCCTLPEKTSDFKLRMAIRLLYLQHTLGSTSKQNAISLSMILRACTSAQKSATVYSLYQTVFSCASSPSTTQPMSFQRDTVLCNGMLDSLLSCQFNTEAYQLFYDMLLTTNNYQQQHPLTMTFTLRFFLGVSKETAVGLATSYSNKPSSSNNNSGRESYKQLLLPKPNQRTFNIFLKGLTLELKHTELNETASTTWEQINLLSKYMKSLGMWDSIATNTLVNAYVSCSNFEDAENILASETADHDYNSASFATSKDHPNIQAYTELYAGYSKHRQYEKAKNVLKLMKIRNVSPNLFTYTVMIQSLARQGEYHKMRSLLRHLVTDKYQNRRHIGEIYNAVFTGLLLDDIPSNTPEDKHQYSTRIHYAIKLFHGLFKNSDDSKRCMLPTKNVVLLSSILFQGLARHCNTISKELSKEHAALNGEIDTEMEQQYELKVESLRNYVKVSSNIHHLVTQLGYVASSTNAPAQYRNDENARMYTPLMSIYGAARDLPMVKQCFSSIHRKDIKALNSYMDACIKCNSLFDALKAFQDYIMENNDDNKKMRPDVATYTILITSILRSATENTGETKSSGSSIFLPSGAEDKLSDMILVTKRATMMYDDMIHRCNIAPDKTLIDW
jgi:pentatricopeptide repeat protein